MGSAGNRLFLLDSCRAYRPCATRGGAPGKPGPFTLHSPVVMQHFFLLLLAGMQALLDPAFAHPFLVRVGIVPVWLRAVPLAPVRTPCPETMGSCAARRRPAGIAVGRAAFASIRRTEPTGPGDERWHNALGLPAQTAGSMPWGSRLFGTNAIPSFGWDGERVLVPLSFSPLPACFAA